jgi:hypothetical protein
MQEKPTTTTTTKIKLLQWLKVIQFLFNLYEFSLLDFLNKEKKTKKN